MKKNSIYFLEIVWALQSREGDQNKKPLINLQHFISLFGVNSHNNYTTVEIFKYIMHREASDIDKILWPLGLAKLENSKVS